MTATDRTKSLSSQNNPHSDAPNALPPSTVASTTEEEIVQDEIDALDRGLLTMRRQRLRQDPDPLSAPRSRYDWIRPYWLGSGLFLALFAFWVLDTLKDPIFGALTGGNLDKHQPPAKLLSVCMTLVLVCFLEYVSAERQKRSQNHTIRSDQDVLDPGGRWNKMHMAEWDPAEESNRVSSSIFVSVGVPYCLGFGIMAYLLQFNPSVALTTAQSVTPALTGVTRWKVLGYFLYGSIESFGSIVVATFWSFTNSNLSLQDAERYYGLIIAIAQLGAIVGSTMVTAYVWSNITLMVLACLVILLHVLVMMSYDKRFPPTSEMIGTADAAGPLAPPATAEPTTSAPPANLEESSLLSGIYLIIRHNYVLLILGASCLYEVSLTCLNYQMTLLGWNRYEESNEQMSMNFTQFMGHYGQLVNASSLILSSAVFPWLIYRFGLRITLRLFPTLLLLANFLAFGALPGNLAVLFVSMSILKAMTYSIHDPSKEILYLPTSNDIKFKAKFWIDVVGARIAKAIGSSINRYAGSVDRSIRVASAPSLLSALGLWYVCYKVGIQFDHLLETGHVVGVDNDEDLRRQEEYSKLEAADEELEVDTGEDSVFEDPTSESLELSPLRRH